jgi:hypothetical protein
MLFDLHSYKHSYAGNILDKTAFSTLKFPNFIALQKSTLQNVELLPHYCMADWKFWFICAAQD